MAGRSEAQRLDGAESSRRIVDVMVGHTATQRVARSLHRDHGATSQLLWAKHNERRRRILLNPEWEA